jgi:protoporphyrinogen oxidase
MERTKFLIVGAGVSGLAFADWIDDEDYIVLEAINEVGGYCRTIKKEGFVWDFSGHFFHFRRPEIEAYLRKRMVGQTIRTVVKQAKIHYADRLIDFPFQMNIHQLPKDQFIDCLVDLYFRQEAADYKGEPDNFEEMLYGKFGKGIADRFLIPYNEKLYATALTSLDVNAMGRFFPYADVEDIIRNFRTPDRRSYNATFTYPDGGAIEYVKALQSGVDPSRIALEEPLIAIDLERKVASTEKREIAFEHLISSVPFPKLLDMAGVSHAPGLYNYNKVLVFNLGFDSKGPKNVHWIYFPSREVSFYRVGFYDNIMGSNRMSLYVELGYPADARLEAADIALVQSRVLKDLEGTQIVQDQGLVASHSVVLDPAYVHITEQSNQDVAAKKASLAEKGVYSIGRYGSWTYCSIEDNIVEARTLAEELHGTVLTSSSQ